MSSKSNSKSKTTKKNPVEEKQNVITPVNKISKEEDDDLLITPVNEENDDDDEITPVNDNKKVIEDDDDLIISVSELNKQDDDLIAPVSEINDETQQDNHKVPVIEPITTQETSIINAAKDELVNFTSKFNPFTQKIGKGLYQVRQYATEKLGTAEDVTQLPQEYKDLEKRVDALIHVHANLLKVTKTYGVQSYDYPESILSVTSHILSNNNEKRVPKTLSHALSRAASSIDGDEGGAYATALSKYAVASDKLGNARLVMDHEIVTNFNQRMQHTQRTSMQGVVTARRDVTTKRLALDAVRSKYKNMGLEVEAAEDQFIGAVEQSTQLMKVLLQDPEPLRDLSAMAQAQLAFFKEAAELLSELKPELEALLKTQETIYRQNSSSSSEQ